MEEQLILEVLKNSFRLEIDNIFEVKNNAIVIYLSNGTKAEIKIKNVA